MKKLCITLLVVSGLFLSGCQSFQKERDLEMYIVGTALTYAAAKHICRNSGNHDEKVWTRRSGCICTLVLNRLSEISKLKIPKKTPHYSTD